MPLSYDSVLAEHRCVRNAVGIFDVSHMGEIRVQGPNAAAFLNSILVNDVSKIPLLGGQYSALCNESGGVIDDLILYKLSNEDFLLCVNASNIEKDYSWIKNLSKSFEKVEAINQSHEWSQIAVQGPNSYEALKTVLSKDDFQQIEKLPYMHICAIQFDKKNCWIARTGYTGEKGFELYIPNSTAEKLWSELLNKNESIGIKAIGLGARDTLRLEACYLLFGNDMDETVSPLEAGISWAVKFSHDFIGKKALLIQKETGLKRQLIAFKMVDAGIPRHGMYVHQNDKSIGLVTSGSVLPSAGGSGGLALIMTEDFNPEKDIFIDIRGSLKKAQNVSKPFYPITAK